MKILITGGAGFIGAYLAQALLAAGHSVIAVDNFDDFVYSPALKRRRLDELIGEHKNFTLETIDITDREKLTALFQATQPDLVLHLAALANPGLSINERERYFAVNVEGTKNVLAACTAANIQRLIFAGSSSVYNDEVVPFREKSQNLRPQSPYGESKAQAEAEVKAWQQAAGDRRVTILRFFSVYGPWGRPDMAPYKFAQQLLKGEVLEVTSEERKRDFTYITDTVQGVVSAIVTPFPFEIINLGRGEPITLSELIEALSRAAGIEPHTKTRPTPPGEMRVTYADISKAKQLLGYSPQVSVTKGAQELVAWLKQYPEYL